MRLKTLALATTLATIALITVGAVYLLVSRDAQTVVSEALTANDASNAELRNGPFPDAYKRTDLPAPDFDLVDQHGHNLRLSALRGQVVVLSFAFAHCAAICPTLVKSLVDTAPKLPSGVKTLIVTLDPQRDTPDSLATTASSWQLAPNMHYLSGEPSKVEGVLDAYKVARDRDATTGDIAHPGLVYVVDAQGQIAYTLNSPSTNWLVGAVERTAQTADKKDASPRASQAAPAEDQAG